MIKWREENDIDNILDEDFSDFDNEYRSYLEGCDKDGRPVISFYVGDWDLRRYQNVKNFNCQMKLKKSGCEGPFFLGKKTGWLDTPTNCLKSPQWMSVGCWRQGITWPRAQSFSNLLISTLSPMPAQDVRSSKIFNKRLVRMINAGIPLLLHVVTSLQLHYPGYVHRVYAINGNCNHSWVMLIK